MTVLSAQRFDNSRDGGCSTLEVRETSRKGRKTPEARPVPLKETSVTGSVQGPLASLVLNQLFDCSFLKEGTAAEAVYRFPLPGDAILRGVTVSFGIVRIATRLTEREEAQAEYDEAVERGHQAALVTRESDDAFTLRIAGLTKDEPVRVETAFLLWLRPTAAGFALRLPLTLAPRYVRDDEATTPRSHAQPLESRWDPRHRVRLSLLCRGVVGAECPTNAIRTADEAGALRVTFAEDAVWPDQDLVLELRSAPRDADGPVRLDVFAAEDAACDGGTFLALAGAPDAPEGAGAPRELLLLVDHSGSMEGPKWEAADWAVKILLSRLGDDDAFNLGFFHDTCRWMARTPVKATEKNRQRGERFIAESTDSGGTELGIALEQALAQTRGEGRVARHVVVLTDAQVSDHDRIAALLERESARGDFRRVSVVCIDAAPNEPLASAMAETGRGIACFLTSNPDEIDIATALDDLFLEFSRPLALGLRLESDTPLAEATGKYAGSGGALDLGDLAAGRPRWICGSFRRNGAVGPVAFRLKDDAGGTLASVSVDLETSASASVDPESSAGEWADAVRGLYGALRVRRLESLVAAPRLRNIPEILRRMGLASNVRETLYPENERLATADIAELLVRESLAAGIPCSKTAFVAVREEAGVKVSERLVVPNALPRGWDAGFAAPMPCAMAPVCECEESMMPEGFAGAAPEPQAQAPVMRMMSVSAPGGRRSVSGILKNMGLLRGKKPQAMSAGSGFAAVQSAAPAESAERLLYDGPVAPGGAGAALFDGVAGEGFLAGLGFLRALVVEATFAEGAEAGEAELRILVNGFAAAKVRLADLLRLGGRRPLNIRLRDGDRVSIELSGADPDGIARLRVSAG